MPEITSSSGKSRIAITCRPALPADTPEVLELTRHIWEGNDYVPLVWQDWLEDTQGRLIVAENASGGIVGLVKLTRLSQEDWWLEGLRVHPDLEGHGIASQLHDFLVATWVREGSGVLRLATNTERLAVHHLCERSGFERVGEICSHSAPALAEEITGVFTPLEQAEAIEATEYTLHSPALALGYGLIDMFWQWAPPNAGYLAELAGLEQIWWWHGRRGLISLRLDEDEPEQPRPFLHFLACAEEDMVDCLLDYRRLAANRGYAHASWMAPLDPTVIAALEKAGFKRDPEYSLYIYAKRHPDYGERI